MSVEVMSQVFKRYPEGGNERLLALAIADHARADGTQVYPSVALLAEMTRQSERSVQRLMFSMLASGWLVLVRKSTGRRGDTNEYRISPEWLAGGEAVKPTEIPDRRTERTGDKLAPVEGAQPVGNLSTTGDTQGLSGDTQGLSGDIAVSPNPSLPIPNQRTPQPPVATGGSGQVRQPKPETGLPAAERDRVRWRWADKRSTIEERGEQLSIAPWDERAFGQGGESFKAFAARVFASHLATLGVSTSPGVVLRALDASDKWCEVLRQLAENNQETKP